MDLNTKTAVVTGSAGGIGLGIVRACLDRGMKVVMSDLDAGRLRETADALRTLGGEVVDHACDVRSRDEVDALRDAACSSFGSIDLVCNNAGVGLGRPITETTDGDWQLLFDVNLHGVINGIRSFLPGMVEQGSGHMNATASLSGLVGDPDLVVYNGTKFAVVGMMEGLALEMHRDHLGITCSVLCPGPVATDLINTSDKQLVDVGSHETAGDDRNEDLVAYLAAGMQPDEVGKIAVDGIAEGKFWLLSHPEETFALLEPRLADMKNGELHVSADWATEQ